MDKCYPLQLLEDAAVYLIKDRGLHPRVHHSVLEGASSGDPDMQALAVLAVMMKRVLNSPTDGWDRRVCAQLGMKTD